MIKQKVIIQIATNIHRPPVKNQFPAIEKLLNLTQVCVLHVLTMQWFPFHYAKSGSIVLPLFSALPIFCSFNLLPLHLFARTTLILSLRKTSLLYSMSLIYHVTPYSNILHITYFI